MPVDPRSPERPASEPFRFRHHPYLGTDLEVRVGGLDEDEAVALDAVVRAEVERLERIFSVFDENSELRRWARRDLARPGPELLEVLTGALHWQRWSGGRFNPFVGVIGRRWARAEREGVEPTEQELEALAGAIAAPRFAVDAEGRLAVLGDLDGADLNAYAKGWIVDRAIDRAVEACHRPASLDLVVNAGGDLRHVGRHPLVVGIENPHRPYDNEPPLTTIGLRNAAVATSGPARRGFTVGERRHSRIIDPRTGHTVEQIASVSVVAPDAATADVAATALGVGEPTEAPARATVLGLACLLVRSDGEQQANEAWRHLETTQ